MNLSTIEREHSHPAVTGSNQSKSGMENIAKQLLLGFNTIPVTSLCVCSTLCLALIIGSNWLAQNVHSRSDAQPWGSWRRNEVFLQLIIPVCRLHRDHVATFQNAT